MTKPAAGYLDLDDIRIAYSEHGSGPNLILLHGNSGSKEMLRSYQTSHFTDFHTWALDSRCHGRSRSDDDSLSIEQIGDDVIRFCRAKGIAEAGVIGYSDGGNIALFLAKKEPALFPRVIAISPNYLVSGTTDSGLRLFRAMRAVSVFIGRLGFDTRRQVLRIDLTLRDIGLTDDDLRGIQTRMLILHAENDLVKEDHIMRMTGLIPGCERVLVPRCSHISIPGKPESITAMRKFLGR